MKLNVILITYNQEIYIRRAVESILMQKTNFDFNIIVADDCSQDDTLNIINDISETSNRDFEFLRNTSNLGFVKNYQRAFSACDAKYIAIMEGDDYWTENNHLQNHVDFLDLHPENSMSFNRHIRLFEDDGKSIIPDWEYAGEYENIAIEQQISTNRIGNLSCCVFRNDIIQSIKPEAFDLEFADWLLGMIVAQYGALAYQKDVTSAYRIHNNGQWSKLTEREQLERQLTLLDSYNEILDFKYDKIFKRRKKAIESVLYGDNSIKGFLKRLYRTITT